jgi:hypothetical protein
MRLARRGPRPPGHVDPAAADGGSAGSGWAREFDQHRWWDRLAGVVVAAAVAVGLVGGGLLGSRGAALRPVAGGQRAAAELPALRELQGPVGELAGLNPLFVLDDRGGAFRQNADGSGREELGGLSDLANRRSSLYFQRFNPIQLGGVPPPGSGWIVPGADRAFVVLRDGTPAVERFADARPHRLVPEGWTPAGPWYPSRDGSTVATCGFKGGRETFAISQVRTWIADADGRPFATLPGCVYDVSPDGSAVLVSDPAAAAAGGRVPEVKGLSSFQGTQSASTSVTRGLRLWRRSGGFQPVLGRSELLRVFRQIQPEVDPNGVAVLAASLSPDGGRALVLARDVLTFPDDASRETSALLLVNLRSQRAQLLPARFPDPGTWVPTGGYITFGPSGTILLKRSRSSVPSLLHVLSSAEGGVDRLEVSPDGSWLLLAGQRWTFIRIDDPAVRVSYRAPGRFAGWGAGTGR